MLVNRERATMPPNRWASEAVGGMEDGARNEAKCQHVSGESVKESMRE